MAQNAHPEQTIRSEIEFRGIGLHSGAEVSISLVPAPAGSGIVFRRTDLDGFEIPATGRNVAKVSYATSLMRGSVLISTTEHLLSALIGYGVDNVIVEVDNLELPILDGSALPYVEAFHSAGLKQQVPHDWRPHPAPLRREPESQPVRGGSGRLLQRCLLSAETCVWLRSWILLSYFPQVELKRESQAELAQSGVIDLAGNLPEGRTAQGRIGRSEVRRIGCVESFEAKLRGNSLSDGELLVDRNVPVEQAGATGGKKPADIAEGE